MARPEPNGAVGLAACPQRIGIAGLPMWQWSDLYGEEGRQVLRYTERRETVPVVFSALIGRVLNTLLITAQSFRSNDIEQRNEKA